MSALLTTTSKEGVEVISGLMKGSTVFVNIPEVGASSVHDGSKVVGEQPDKAKKNRLIVIENTRIFLNRILTSVRFKGNSILCYEIPPQSIKDGKQNNSHDYFAYLRLILIIIYCF